MSERMQSAGMPEYNNKVRELFNHLNHSGTMESGPDVLSASAGAVEQGASITIWLAVQEGKIRTVRYQAYGCPHFLASCEYLAQCLEGRPFAELTQWNWRDAETELAVPASKRARLLILEEALRMLQ